jgi:hypothetical protein
MWQNIFFVDAFTPCLSSYYEKLLLRRYREHHFKQRWLAFKRFIANCNDR